MNLYKNFIGYTRTLPKIGNKVSFIFFEFKHDGNNMLYVQKATRTGKLIYVEEVETGFWDLEAENGNRYFLQLI